MSEATLQHPVGGSKVMVDQLERPVERAALDTVTLRVLPLASGAHVGMSTVVTLLSFGERDEPDVVYTENLLGSTLTERKGWSVGLPSHSVGCGRRRSAPKTRWP